VSIPVALYGAAIVVSAVAPLIAPDHFTPGHAIAAVACIFTVALIQLVYNRLFARND
jgi:hypothetical protein